MQRRKLLYTLAIVFAALSFGLNAKAQGVPQPPNVPVYLTYGGSNFTPYSFDVFLYNNDTGSGYQLWANSFNGEYMPNVYRLGTVPEGNNYTVSIKLRGWGEGLFDWNAKGQSGTKVALNGYEDYIILTNVAITGDMPNNNWLEEGIHITIKDDGWPY